MGQCCSNKGNHSSPRCPPKLQELTDSPAFKNTRTATVVFSSLRQRMIDDLESKNRRFPNTPPTIIVGPTKSGKITLMMDFVSNCMNRNKISNVLWFSMRSPEAMRESVFRTAKEMGIDTFLRLDGVTYNKDALDVFEDIGEALAMSAVDNMFSVGSYKRPPTIVVFYNIDTLTWGNPYFRMLNDKELYSYFICRSYDPRPLRLEMQPMEFKEVGSLKKETVFNIPPCSRMEANEVMYQSALKIKDLGPITEELKVRLFELTKFHPGALNHVLQSCEVFQIPLEGMVEQLGLHIQNGGGNTTPMAAFEMSIERLYLQEWAKNGWLVLTALAYCGPTMRKRVWSQITGGNDEIDAFVKIQLIDVDNIPENDTLHIPTAVKETLRSFLTKNDEEGNVLERLYNIFVSFSDTPESLPHFAALLTEIASKVPELGTKHWSKFIDISRRLRHKCMLQENIVLTNTASSLFSKVFGLDDARSIFMEHRRLIALEGTLPLDENVKLRDALTERCKRIGCDTQLTLSIIEKQGTTFQNMGDFESSIPLFQSVWEKKKEHYGANHHETLRTRAKYLWSADLASKGNSPWNVIRDSQKKEIENWLAGLEKTHIGWKNFQIYEACHLGKGGVLRRCIIDWKVLLNSLKEEMGEDHVLFITALFSIALVIVQHIDGEEFDDDALVLEECITAINHCYYRIGDLLGEHHPRTMAMGKAITTIKEVKDETDTEFMGRLGLEVFDEEEFMTGLNALMRNMR